MMCYDGREGVTGGGSWVGVMGGGSRVGPGGVTGGGHGWVIGHRWGVMGEGSQVRIMGGS